MPNRLLSVLTGTLLSISLLVGTSHASTTVKVGIYQNPPLVSFDSSGYTSGIYIETLEYIAAKENWTLEYVQCVWADCLVQVEDGSIDLLTAIAYSKKRSEKYDFNRETFFSNWGQVYTNHNVIINSIADLEGKTVAGLEGDIYYTALKDVTSRANLNISYVDVDEYEAVFREIENGTVVAGILPRLFGEVNESRFNVKKNITIIRPSELRFAAPKSTSRLTLETIDRHLHALKADKKSIYFQSISKWIGTQEDETSVDLKFTSAEVEWLAANKHIRLGVDPDFVPFEFIDADESYRGICADFVRIVSARTGISMEVAADLAWSDVIERAKGKMIDVLPCVGMTEERKKFLNYSKPHQKFFRVIVSKKGSAIENSLDGLSKSRVAVQVNSSHHGFLKDNTDIEPLLFETAEQAIIAVTEARADIYIGNENTSGYLINKNGFLNLKMERLSGYAGKQLFFAVRNDWPELLTIIDKGLASITEEEKEAIRQRWLAVKIEKRFDYLLMYKIVGVILFILLILGLWNVQIRRQKRVLQDSEEKYRTLVEGLHEGYFFYSHDLQGQFTYISPSIEQILGYSASEMARSFRSILTDNPINEDAKKLATLCILGEQQPSYTIEVQHQNRTLHWLEISEVPIFDKTGNVIAIEGIAHDITERLNAENALHKSEKRYRSLADNSQVGILQITPDGSPIYINPMMLEMIGAKEVSQIRGKNVMDFVVPECRRVMDREMAKRHQNISSTYEVEIFSLCGARKSIMISGGPIMDENGKLESIISSIIDITDRIKNEEDLRKAKNAAEAANLAKTTFLANMSHELRTPLNAILGFSELMTRDLNLTEEQLGNLKTIGRSGKHLLNLIHDVLELSKIEAGHIVLHPENFDLYHLLFVIEEMFSLRARENGLTLLVERAPDLPQFIRADQGKLRQTLINILGNSIKFTTEGEITLRVRSEAERLYFEVEDTGEGIAADELEAIFDVFVQSASGINSRQGSGLGIPISQNFVQIMGGELTAQCREERGTIFRFCIEIEITDHADESSYEQSRRVVGIKDTQPTYRILVVDDNEDSRKLLAALMMKGGFEVREAVNGEDAVNIWQEWQPHLIWMDIRMPVLNGLEATKAIKSAVENTPSVIDPKIIALTANAFEEDKIEAIENGCDDFIRKPFQESEIFKVIHQHLGVEFIYDNSTIEADSATALPPLLMSDLQPLMADLPDELLQQLSTASNLCDAERAAQVIEEISSHNQLLANSLAELSAKFAFDEIQSLINQPHIIS